MHFETDRARINMLGTWTLFPHPTYKKLVNDQVNVPCIVKESISKLELSAQFIQVSSFSSFDLKYLELDIPLDF